MYALFKIKRWLRIQHLKNKARTYAEAVEYYRLTNSPVTIYNAQIVMSCKCRTIEEVKE